MHSSATTALEHELVRLARTARAAGRRAARALSPGLDEGGYALVLALGRLEPAHAGQLADELGLDKSTVSRQLASLVERGLVERSADPADGRARLVRLSPAARDQLAEARAAGRSDLSRVVGAWPVPDVEAATTVLARLSDGLARLAVAPGTVHPPSKTTTDTAPTTPVERPAATTQELLRR